MIGRVLCLLRLHAWEPTGWPNGYTELLHAPRWTYTACICTRSRCSEEKQLMREQR